MHQDETSPDIISDTVKTTDIAKLWERGANTDETNASMGEFLNADDATIFCEEVTDEVIT